MLLFVPLFVLTVVSQGSRSPQCTCCSAGIWRAGDSPWGYVPGRLLLNNHLSNFTQPSQPTPLKKTSPFQAQQKPNRKGVYYDSGQLFKPIFEFWRSKPKGSQFGGLVYNKCGKIDTICIYYSPINFDIPITLESNLL